MAARNSASPGEVRVAAHRITADAPAPVTASDAASDATPAATPRLDALEVPSASNVDVERNALQELNLRVAELLQTRHLADKTTTKIKYPPFCEETDPTKGNPSASKEGGAAGAAAAGQVWVARNLLSLGLAFMALYVAMKGAANLQSSLHAEGGLGAAALTAYYVAFLISSLFLPSLFIRRLGCRATIVVSLIAYVPYIGAQLVPSFWTMVPGGLLAGLAAGPLWVAQSACISHLAHSARAADRDALTVKLFGAFYMLYQLSQVWGNIISSAVLSQGDEDAAGASGAAAEADSALPGNASTAHCGALFCPGRDDADIHLVRPPQGRLATLSYIYLGCVATAVAVVLCGVDYIPKSAAGAGRRKQEEAEVKETKKEEQEKKDWASGEVKASDEENETEGAWATILATLRLTKRREILLLVPVTVFLGVEDTFISSDYTAAFVSCSWGIHHIGYVMLCYGVANAVSSAAGGWAVKMVGRMPVVMAATALHATAISALRLWSLQDSPQAPLFFALAAAWGTADGVWQAQINAMFGLLFPDQEEASYSAFRLWQCSGYILAYGYSAHLCTSTKLYLLQANLLVGMAGYVTAEMGLRRRVVTDDTLQP